MSRIGELLIPDQKGVTARKNGSLEFQGVKVLEIKVGEHAGFCPGVRRAVEMALMSVGRGKEGVTLGPLVHNESVVRYLTDRGIR